MGPAERSGDVKRLGIHGGGEAKRFPGGARSRRAGVIGAVLLALLGGGGFYASSAEAAEGPTNHIFISFHGLPTYTWTVRLLNIDGEETHFDQTCVGGCKRKIPWDPNKVRSASIKINSGAQIVRYDFTSSFGSGHDHCVLVKAGGQVVSTGDETQGCHKP
jgi:hypothetical protein